MLLHRAQEQFPRLSHLWLDGGYRGEDKGKDWVEKTLGWSVDLVERAHKPAPEEVLRAWAREWAKEGGVALDWQKLLPPKGFQVLPRRWVVEMSQPQCHRTCSFLAPLGSRAAPLPMYSPAWSPAGSPSERRSPANGRAHGGPSTGSSVARAALPPLVRLDDPAPRGLLLAGLNPAPPYPAMKRSAGHPELARQLRKPPLILCGASRAKLRGPRRRTARSPSRWSTSVTACRPNLPACLGGR